MIPTDLPLMQYNASRLTSGSENIKNQIRNNKLFDACKDFESIFIKQMLDSMKKTVNKGTMLKGGYAEKIYEDMLYDEYAKKMAKTANFGIADTLYRQLAK